MFESKYHLSKPISALSALRVLLAGAPNSELQENTNSFIHGFAAIMEGVENSLRVAGENIDHEIAACYTEKNYEGPGLGAD